MHVCVKDKEERVPVYSVCVCVIAFPLCCVIRFVSFTFRVVVFVWQPVWVHTHTHSRAHMHTRQVIYTVSLSHKITHTLQTLVAQQCIVMDGRQ